MDGFNWVVSALQSAFGLLNVPLFGVPAYVFFIFAFVMGLLAKFLHGRR